MMFFDVDVALSEVPVNACPLIDDTDFKTRETSVAYNASGMDLVWNFVTAAGAFTQTAVTPTTAGNYDWTNQGKGFYTIEIPASGGASINNDTEGYGWFTGFVTGILPFTGPIMGFRAAGLNDLLVEGTYSTTRGLCGTAVPAVAAEAAGGLVTNGTGTGQLSLSSGLVNITQTAADKVWSSTTRTLSAFSTALAVSVWDVLASAVATASSIGKQLKDNVDGTVTSRMATYTQPTGFLAATFPSGTIANTTNITAGTITTTTNLTTNNDKTGYGLSSAAIQAIWDALTSALTTVGSIGKLLVDNINATISSRLASASYTTPPTVVDIRTEMDSNSTKLANLDAAISTRATPAQVATELATYDAPTNAEMVARTLAAASYATAAGQATIEGKVDTVDANVDAILDDTGTSGVVVATNNDKTGYGLSAAAVTAVWAYITEGTWTMVKLVRLWSSVLVGKNSGMGTATGTFRDIDDTKDRIVVTQDASGNRSAFSTLDGT